MGILTRAGDLVYTFRFLKLLVTPFENTDAYKLGVIDQDGKRDKSVKLDTSDKKSAYTTFHRLVYNIKRIMGKAPGGSSRLASYAAALFLIKEDGNLSDKAIDRILQEMEVDEVEMFAENNNWFVLEDQTIAPGMYRINGPKLTNTNCEHLVNAKDQIRICETNNEPVGWIASVPIYEATHIRTGLSIYVAAGELIR